MMKPDQFPYQGAATVRPILPAPRIWSQGFIVLVVLIALLGGIVALLGIAGMSGNGFSIVDFTPGNLAFLALDGGLLVMCLAGLYFLRSPFLQAGLLLQAGAAASAIVETLVTLQIIETTSFDNLYFSLALLTSVLNLLSLVCLSYGLARWQPSDMVFLPLQVLLALGLSFAMVARLDPQNALYAQVALHDFCDLAAITVVLARPACWKVSPLIVACLTIASLASRLDYGFYIGPFPTFATAQPFQWYYGLGMSATLLFLIGVLLIVQTARVQRKAMQQP